MSSAEMVSIVHPRHRRERTRSRLLGLAKIVNGREREERPHPPRSDEVGHMTKLEKHLISVLRGKDWVIERADLVEAMSEQVSQPSVLEKIDARSWPRPTRYGSSRSRSTGGDRGEPDLPRDGGTLEEGIRRRRCSSPWRRRRSCTRRSCGPEVDAIGQNGFWCDMQEFTMEQ